MVVWDLSFLNFILICIFSFQDFPAWPEKLLEERAVFTDFSQDGDRKFFLPSSFHVPGIGGHHNFPYDGILLSEFRYDQPFT